jgi:hypothetical protein
LACTFSTDGWLDHGTKLLDIGLEGVMPIGALCDPAARDVMGGR